VARYRLAAPSKADIQSILRTSESRHGAEPLIRYRGLLTAALRRISRDPLGALTLDWSDLTPRLGSLQVRRVRSESREVPVATPLHVVFYRMAGPDLAEVVRVLHERMEPSRHLGGLDE
jgi:toxin ParE1/3/4